MAILEKRTMMTSLGRLAELPVARLLQCVLPILSCAFAAPLCLQSAVGSDLFQSATLTILSKSLQHDIEVGDVEFAHLHAIQLQLAVLANLKRQSTAPAAANDETELRARFLTTLSARPAGSLAKDPTRMVSLLPLVSKLLETIYAGDLESAGSLLGRISVSLGTIHEEYLTLHITKRIEGERDPELQAYMKMTRQLFESLRSGDFATAETIAPEILSMVETYRAASGMYGDNLFNAYDALGRAAFQKGDFESAQQYLLKAADTPGSPNLDSFGPSLWLAKALLDQGYREAVIAFLRSSKTFWKNPAIDQWIVNIQAGGHPSFLPNSRK
jgi:tetratricopeptide (TPR) repeat protein